MNGIRSYLSEVFWKTPGRFIFLATAVITIGQWFIDIGDTWTLERKAFSSAILFLGVLSFGTVRASYSMHTRTNQILSAQETAAYLPVKTIISGPFRVAVILDTSDTVFIGDVLSIFNTIGDAEFPVCVISIDAVTDKGFLQGSLVPPQSDESLSEFLNEPERLTAKRSITIRDIECLNA